MNMNRNRIRPVWFVSVISVIVLLSGCMDASLSQSGNAPASISIQDAPSAIPDVGISITGGGVNISETVGPGTDALVFELPVGQEHEVTIDTTNFIGRKSFVLPPGGAQVDVQMLEKLFVPDPGNDRLVQVNDLSGAGWEENALLPGSVQDAGVGPDGSIYVVSDVLGDGDALFKLDSISDSAPTGIDPFSTSAATSVAIDSDRGLVYYVGDADGNGTAALYRVGLNGETPKDMSSLIADFFGEIFEADTMGLSVDDSGDIYVSNIGSSESPEVRKIDPDADEILWSYTVPSDISSYLAPDVTYSEGAVYVTNAGGPPGYRILVLDANTGDLADSFGAYPSDPNDPQSGEFYGPTRFIESDRPKLLVLDEPWVDTDNADPLDNRILSFDPDSIGDTWQTYGSDGSLQDEFAFFSVY